MAGKALVRGVQCEDDACVCDEDTTCACEDAIPREDAGVGAAGIGAAGSGEKVVRGGGAERADVGGDAASSSAPNARGGGKMP